MRKLLSFFCLSIISFFLVAQQGNFIVSGQVTDNTTKEALIGVNIISNDIGTSTNIDGNYTLKLPYGKHEIIFKYIGYEVVTKKININTDSLLKINLQLNSSSEQLNTVVVSAGKFNQKLEEITVSMEVIKPNLIENKSSSNIETAM